MSRYTIEKPQKIYFVILITVLFISTSNGQTKEDLNQGNTIPKVYLKTNLTFLINPIRSSAMLSTGIKHTEDYSFEIGLGYYLNSNTYANRKREKYTGPRVQAAYKYFFYNGKMDSWFAGLEVGCDWITNSSWETLSRQGGQFSEISLVDKKINSASLSLQLGQLLFLDQNKHFFLEFYTGAGMIMHDVHWELPEDAMIIEGDVNFFLNSFSPGRTFKPRLWLGVNIGYAIW